MLTAAHQPEHIDVAIDALGSALSRCADATIVARADGLPRRHSSDGTD
jgi:hypothetical protein